MRRSLSIYRILAGILCLVLLSLVLCTGIGAETLRTYTVNLDNPVSLYQDNAPVVVKNYDNGAKESLVIEGWVNTDQIMHQYEYSVDGGKTWIEYPGAVVPRRDVKSICPNTYTTAGYHIEIDTANMARGCYDIFVQGYTENGDLVAIAALLDTLIGDADVDTVAFTELNLKALGAQDGILTLNAGQSLCIGTFNLANYQALEITLDYGTVLTLGSADADSPFHFSVSTDSAMPDAQGVYMASANLRPFQYAGKLLLTAEHNAGITGIRLYKNSPDYYTGNMKVFMALNAYDYLGGANRTAASLHTDPTVGTYTKVYPTEAHNDPYIYFNMGSYLKETAGQVINADHYRYAVITLQTPPTNTSGYFRLFLCAGDVRGPSGNSHVAFSPINDGQWHKYVIPLCDEDDWTGQIHGIRFDFIDNDVTPADYANIASIELFADQESAQAEAEAPFEFYEEQGELPEDKHKEEGRAPSGRADTFSWFDSSFESCFDGHNDTSVSFDQYGHVILKATENCSDPYVSFDMKGYAAIAGTSALQTSDYKIIVIRAMADKEITGRNFTLYYYCADKDFAEEARTVRTTYQGGDEWEYIIFDFSEETNWTGEILGARLDYATQINAGHSMYISDFLFFADMSAWESYAKEHGVAINGSQMPEAPTTAPEQTLPDFEIPTQGPGLELIPPETQEQTTQAGEPITENGCKAWISLPLLLSLLPISFVFCFKSNTKKGDKS